MSPRDTHGRHNLTEALKTSAAAEPPTLGSDFLEHARRKTCEQGELPWEPWSSPETSHLVT